MSNHKQIPVATRTIKEWIENVLLIHGDEHQSLLKEVHALSPIPQIGILFLLAGRGSIYSTVEALISIQFGEEMSAEDKDITRVVGVVTIVTVTLKDEASVKINDSIINHPPLQEGFLQLRRTRECIPNPKYQDYRSIWSPVHGRCIAQTCQWPQEE